MSIKKLIKQLIKEERDLVQAPKIRAVSANAPAFKRDDAEAEEIKEQTNPLEAKLDEVSRALEMMDKEIEKLEDYEAATNLEQYRSYALSEIRKIKQML